ncbi:hypothetical protein B0F90DRAFT_1705693 [Multifurca ochricompacta]|uniref:Bud22 domain-containing protein n=1 Tax=Multifurca ochricompacta TaxID=376703 RepID=A0AAD4QQB6_9AGAM|nr:hypothetical protein B0F90DRAFT_1705693 [Multifurca ochricompacta]
MHFSTNPRGRGIKRKHSSPSAGGDAKKILGKLFHCLKEVKKAAKKAKAFETRKIVKRLKSSGNVSLRKKSPDKGMLSKELDVLKTINHDRIGTLALRNKLKKDKFLSSEPSVQMAISEVLASDTIPASEGILAKLETRLLSSKPLSEGVTTAISSLYVALELKQDNGNGVEEGPSRPHKLPKVNIPAATEPRATLDLSEGTTQHSFVGSGSRRGTSVSRSVSVSDQELGNSGAPDINTSEDHDLLTNGHSPPHAG